MLIPQGPPLSDRCSQLRLPIWGTPASPGSPALLAASPSSLLITSLESTFIEFLKLLHLKMEQTSRKAGFGGRSGQTRPL